MFQAEGEDSLKKMQLMELAILNGTYRDANIKPCKRIDQSDCLTNQRPITDYLTNQRLIRHQRLSDQSETV